jgi:hypothetical protein
MTPQTPETKVREQIRQDLLKEKIPGCSGKFDEEMGKHIVHMVEWLIESLVDARVKLALLGENKPVRNPLDGGWSADPNDENYMGHNLAIECGLAHCTCTGVADIMCPFHGR